jgi:hypothetical protein
MDVNELVEAVFSGLSPLIIEDVADEGERILVRARTLLGTVVCAVCGASSERVHGYHWRTVADVPVDERRVVVRVRVRRLGSVRVIGRSVRFSQRLTCAFHLLSCPDLERKHESAL